MLNIYYILYSKFFLTFSKLWFSQKENLKKYTSFEEHKDTRYIQRNALKSTKIQGIFRETHKDTRYIQRNAYLKSTKIQGIFRETLIWHHHLQLSFVYKIVSQISSAVFCLPNCVSDFFSCLLSTKTCLRFLQLSVVCKTVSQISSAISHLQNCVPDFFSCLSSTKLCIKFLLIYFAQEIKGFYHSSFVNEVDFTNIMNISPNILAKIKISKIWDRVL